MNENTRSLIRAVVDNDINKAKAYCRIIVDADKTQKDATFCKNIINKLEMQKNFIELPANVRNLLIAEDVAATFNEHRYYLSEREESLFGDIKKMCDASEHLERMGIKYHNSVLLYGESGTGKTMFAKYVAYKLGLPFVSMGFAHTIDSYLGGTGKNLQKIFDYVKNTKCVFMLDEIDAVGIQRGNTNESGEINRVVIGLMQEIDNLPSGVLFMAASNREDILDSALKRRFSIKHKMEKLSPKETETMIKMLLTDIGVESRGIVEYVERQKDRAPAIVLNDVILRIATAIKNAENTIDFVDEEQGSFL